jgi:hypothetical protein
MLKQRHCCHCGGTGPFVRAVTCQDARGEVFDQLCLCVSCEGALSDEAFRERIRSHIAEEPVIAPGETPMSPEYGASISAFATR